MIRKHNGLRRKSRNGTPEERDSKRPDSDLESDVDEPLSTA